MRAAPRAIRAYKAPLVDGRGRIALYFRVRYLGLKSKNWRPGLAADHALYILREQALDDGEITRDALPLSNMGVDADEVAACWQALETIEEGYRANAKVQYRIVWNLPHDLTSAERREMVEDFCERTFGRLGLPWVAGIHKPDQRGDQRNYHAHVGFSTRPCERTGSHQWSIAQEKVNGLTDEDGLKLMRALAAGHMNIACRRAGLAARFTHQTYQERGIDAQRQEHVGPAAMAAHEAGDAVAVIQRNAQRIEANERAAERDRIARALADTDRLVQIERERLDLVQFRRRIARVTERARLISRSAKGVATGIGLRVLSPISTAQIRRIAARVNTMREVAARSVGAPRTHIAGVGDMVASIAERARVVAAGQRGSDAGHSKLAAAHDTLRTVAEMKAKWLAVRAAQAKLVILTSPAPPYTVVDGRATADFSRLTASDRALVLELNHDAQIEFMRERIRRDYEEQRRQEHERAEAEQRDRTAQQTLENQRMADARRAQETLRVAAAQAEALERESKARRAAAEAARQQDGERTLRQLLEMLKAERHLLRPAGPGYAPSAELLARLKLTAEEIAAQPVQKALEPLIRRQNDEISRIATYTKSSPEALRLEGDRWALDERAPSDLRQLVALWHHEPLVHQALARAAATASTPAQSDEPPPSQPGEQWIRARAMRRAATAGWEGPGMGAASGLPQPGGPPGVQPGPAAMAQAQAAEETHATAPPRRVDWTRLLHQRSRE